jgi:hypothetical protein
MGVVITYMPPCAHTHTHTVSILQISAALLNASTLHLPILKFALLALEFIYREIQKELNNFKNLSLSNLSITRICSLKTICKRTVTVLSLSYKCSIRPCRSHMAHLNPAVQFIRDFSSISLSMVNMANTTHSSTSSRLRGRDGMNTRSLA